MGPPIKISFPDNISGHYKAGSDPGGGGGGGGGGPGGPDPSPTPYFVYFAIQIAPEQVVEPPPTLF